MELILGSQSPRRREILSYFSLPFKQVSPDFDEEAIPFQGDPKAFAETLSRGKAESLHEKFSHQVILTADTVVCREGKNYGKPKDDEEAFQFLTELSGQWHSVFTSLTVCSKGSYFQSTAETRVLFNRLSKEQIKTYIRQLHFLDKAGGYMIQGAGSLIVNKIEGCYYNVVGLPLNALAEVLGKVGIDLWNFLKP